jgi:hypothetical protein
LDYSQEERVDMSAFVLACYMATVASGSIYFKSIRDCLFYSEHLSGQQLETKDGIKQYNCMCKLVPQIDPEKVRVY